MTDDTGFLDPLAGASRAIELTSDAAWLQALVDAELALSRALVDVGLAPDWMMAVADSLTDASQLDLAAIATQARGGGNPVIPLVKHLGAAADAMHAGASEHIHVGATSQDMLDTALMLVAQRVAQEATAQLNALAGSLAVLAPSHRASIMVGRTLGQHATPTSFGFVVSGWLDETLGAMRALDEARSSLPAQLGGAVGTLSVLTEISRSRAATGDVVAAFASRLGLAIPASSWHTDRAPVLRIAAALASAATVAGLIAADVSVLSRTEVAELNERLGSGEGGSSAMPHKRNPVTSVLVSAEVRQVPGLLATVFASAVAEDQRPSGAWHAEWPALRSLERATIAAVSGAASLAERLEVDPERMRANLDLTNGLVYSESITTIIAEQLGKHAAFELVEAAARESVATHRPLQIVIAGALAEQQHSEELLTRIWDAFATPELGRSDTAIDNAVARYRSLLSEGTT